MQQVMTPAETVKWLDRHVIGQNGAKRTVAIALRNRYRRRLVEEPMRSEINPSNMIMMGPTGVGKTEIARRMAALVGAPFVKVEATKYTETGYVGRDVEGIIRDLVRSAVNLATKKARENRTAEAEARVRTRLLAALKASSSVPDVESEAVLEDLLDGMRLEYVQIELSIAEQSMGVEVFPMIPGQGFDNQMNDQMKKMLDKVIGRRRKKVRIKVSDARKRLFDEEMNRLLDGGDHVMEGLRLAQEEGIVFIDEIDKIIGSEGGSGPDVSRMGVQRDLLPLVEGSTVATKYGTVKTDHILFIAAGAFHGSSPADLIPELQGRFPLRVSLDPLSQEDLKRILTEPENCILDQYLKLLEVDGVTLKVDDSAANEIASAARYMNNEKEDIGARRLRSVLSYLMEDYLFGAPDLIKGRARLTGRKVAEKLSGLVERSGEEGYIL
ncbi:HslU--HslV peptidase ATPase subunit [Candidatus Fermentibacteria bacterium]|nr:MAG: HslU--HslV peptidase ATPase subunit [Candidatus Fermentibacteria bacterium]PIE52268.1 MAG: HslU--HslV peptidase ATPase subunit [Candidatus Fermentibacteria bacterium]PIE52763.1 MAG: HslU--HslV peptidase ATPase subunit [Candidatus Fermentibacteria bacterium]